MKYVFFGFGGLVGAIAIQQMRFVFPWLSEFGMVFNLLCLVAIAFLGLGLAFQVWQSAEDRSRLKASNFTGTGIVLVGMVATLVLTQELGRWLAS